MLKDGTDATVGEDADLDSDGYPASEDCDDSNASVNPAAEETCNVIDDDCDGVTDESDAVDASIWYADGDADGYGDPDRSQAACYQPSGYVADGSDCDPTTASVGPGSTEYCNGIDDDCDGVTDEDDAVDATTWYVDIDGDSYGDGETSVVACEQPTGHVSDASDCNDTDGNTFPGADEYCDGEDDDCNGFSDEAYAVDATFWYSDADDDGFGDPASAALACAQPSGYVADASDCDDSLSSSHPGATEFCNGTDDDCDGVTDEDDADDAATWYADADGDAFGDASTTTMACSTPTGYVADSTDCNDGDDATYPGAPEYCDLEDDDCDGTTDEDDAVDVSTWYLDSDGDGYGEAASIDSACWQPAGYVAAATDCDDADSETHPGADEYCNGSDDDCDGTTDEDDAVDVSTWYRDADGDSYGTSSRTDVDCDQPSGYVADSADCNDGSASIYPGADEYCDLADNDCDGTVDEGAVDAMTWYLDADGDSYGDTTATAASCSPPTGYAAASGDCDESDSGVNPGASETEYDGIDQDCDGTDLADVDGDGYDADVVSGGTDCDDNDPETYPGASEIACDDIDQDCDGSDATEDADGDGYDCLSDCDDNDATVSPDATEVCANDVDEDCSGEYSDGCSTKYYDCGGDTTMDVGDTFTCNIGSTVPVDSIYISVGCNDGETGTFRVTFDDGSRETVTGSCDSTHTITERLTRTMRLYMSSGGGSDRHISFNCCGSDGWGAYYH